MHFQYPLETLARRRARVAQLDFARKARGLLEDSDDALFQPTDRGLVILAAHEEALEAPRRLLQDLFGDEVEVRRPRVRRLPGEPSCEPVMHVRVTARREHAPALVAELRRRGARILEECLRSRVFIVRAEAPLAALLGFPAWLAELSDGLAAASIRLLRYVPSGD